MDLRHIQHDLIAKTTDDDWYVVKVPGPSFHYRWQFGSDTKGPTSYIIGEHSQHAVCRSEPSLTMSWGMDINDRAEERRTSYPWAQNFANKTVHEFWVDFFWNNALIDRVELGRIDGGHGTIPMPVHGLKVTDFEIAVAFLVHNLESGPNRDNPGNYITRLRFVRIADVARLGAGSKV